MSAPGYGVERYGHTAVVRIARPKRANALRVSDAEAMARDLMDLDDDASVRAIVLAGSERYFCAGADLSDLAEADPFAHIDRIHRLLRNLIALRTPTIAALRGIAVGAGLNLALACDLVVAGEGTRASEIFIHRGLAVDFAGSALLVAALGPHRAKELAFFGGELTTGELAALVNRVVPDEHVEPLALRWAEELAGQPRLALTLTKRLIDAAAPSLSAALEREVIAQLAATTDNAVQRGLERWR